MILNCLSQFAPMKGPEVDEQSSSWPLKESRAVEGCSVGNEEPEDRSGAVRPKQHRRIRRL
jgi:hypothetical protein